MNTQTNFINSNYLVIFLLFTVAIMSPCAATTAPTAQSAPVVEYVVDPLLEEPPNTFSDAELGGIGCLVASTAISGGMLYLMGGIGTALTSMTPPIHPAIVLEGSAAVAFVLSSACYIGVALAPVVVSTYGSISNSFTQELPLRPLFAPGELLAIGNGNLMPPQSQISPTAPQQQQPTLVVPTQ